MYIIFDILITTDLLLRKMTARAPPGYAHEETHNQITHSSSPWERNLVPGWRGVCVCDLCRVVGGDSIADASAELPGFDGELRVGQSARRTVQPGGFAAGDGRRHTRALEPGKVSNGSFVSHVSVDVVAGVCVRIPS